MPTILDSLVVRISACHVEGPGSIPDRGITTLFLVTHVQLEFLILLTTSKEEKGQNLNLTVQGTSTRTGVTNLVSINEKEKKKKKKKKVGP